METGAPRRLARIDRAELAGPGPDAPLPERGRHLRRLLQGKGIDPDRLYHVEYYPGHHCWLVTQEEAPPRRRPARPADEKADTLFFVQVMTELQGTARHAVRAWAAHSMHFARFGRKFELPGPARELPLSELVDLLGGPGDDTASVRFDSEGRWHDEPPS
jgi:hypothetical protein